VNGLLALVKVFNDGSEVIQVLTNYCKLLDSEFFSVVVIVEMVGLNLLELLFLVRLLHVDCVVIKTRDVFGSIDNLAGLEVVDRLRSSLSVLAKLF